MSRYIGPRLKIVHRLGELPGLTRKTLANKKQSSIKKASQYGIRLETKQKLRFNYGVTEKQLIQYIKRARGLSGSTGKILLKLLEMRLDNIIFRVGLAPTIPAARQMVNHGHILVNNNKMSIPSYQCQPNDKISTKKIDNNNLEPKSIPSHLDFNIKSNLITVLSDIRYEEVGLDLNELLIVEYYSRS
uniref:Small ribosomal subunit protein uS4c n=1 Tax=Ostreobium sp. HV05007bc TaxID=1940403 RepID=A0A2P0QGZ7_9CHLO|nr:ribosomal protein S4 [Ostreobium sp. HV05007bc]